MLDSGGSGERTASNIQDAASRGVDAIIVSMSDLRASRAAIDSAVAAKIPVFAIDSGQVDGVLVDVTTNNWAMSASVSPYLLNEMGGKGNLIFLRMAEHHGTRKRGDIMATVLKEYPEVKILAELTSIIPLSLKTRPVPCRTMLRGLVKKSMRFGLHGMNQRRRQSTL